jgi:hypothetical protein
MEEDKTPQLLHHLVSNVKNLTPNVLTVGVEKYSLSFLVFFENWKISFGSVIHLMSIESFSGHRYCYILARQR